MAIVNDVRNLVHSRRTETRPRRCIHCAVDYLTALPEVSSRGRRDRDTRDVSFSLFSGVRRTRLWVLIVGGNSIETRKGAINTGALGPQYGVAKPYLVYCDGTVDSGTGAR